MANISDLNQRLKSKIQEDKTALESQSVATLEKHAKSLSKLSADALSTTNTGIGKYQAALDKLHQDTLQRVKWQMLWPLATGVCLSLLIVLSAMAWSWWTVSQADDQVKQKQELIQRMTAEFCSSPAGLKACNKG